MDSEKQKHWSAHISRQLKSSQSQRLYCQSQGINFHSFSYWAQKLKGKRKRKPKSPKFLPVNLKTSQSGSAHAYELTLPSGSVLKFSKGFDLEEVRGLLPIISKQ